LFAFIAAISQASGIIIDKIVLTRREVELRVFIPVLFLFLMLSTAIILPFFGWVKPEIAEPKYLIVFAAMLLTAIIWNVFYYRGAQKQKVQEFELIMMFQPLFTIFLAAVLIERNVSAHVFIASVIAAVALIAAHLRKMHFEFNQYSWGLIGAVVFMSAEIILQKILLNVFSPVALYFIRTLIIFLFFYFYYKPSIEKVSSTNSLLIAGSALLGTAQMVSKLYGYGAYGVIYTSLVMIAAPILVYILSTILLHEKMKFKTIASAVVIIGCIVYATLLGK
jgi:drug/metabolite transporter (DMT)-like permease